MTIYLYVKQHSVTGLKYFGKTVSEDPFSYNGSGTYWQNHIKKHGTQFIKTIELYKFEDQKEAMNFALRFSEVNNIVESSEWANLTVENALDGQPKGIKLKENHKKNISLAMKESRLGIKHSLETKTKMSNSHLNKTISEETRAKISSSIKGKKKQSATCPKCGKTGSKSNMVRWHFDNCKLKP